MSKQVIMSKETLYKIFAVAEQEHFNLFHDIPKENFYKELDKVGKNIESLNKRQVNYEMSRLFALFKDGHTTYVMSNNWLPINFLKVDNKIYLVGIHSDFKDLLFKEVQKINGFSVKDIVEKAKNLIPAETEVWRYFKAIKQMRDAYFLNMLDIGDFNNGMEITVENKKYFIPNELNKYFTPDFLKPIKQNYQIENLQNITVMKYLKCREDPTYSLQKFYDDFDNVTKIGDEIIIDLRNNGGGSDVPFRKIVDIIKSKQIKGYALIDRGCFSSAIWAIESLKENGFILIGEETGGVPPKHRYGNLNKCVIDDYAFTVSNKFFDKTDGILPEGSVKPDIEVLNTIEDYRNGRDRFMEKAISLIQEKNLEIKPF